MTVSSLSQYIAVNAHKRDKGIGYLPLRVLSQKMEEKTYSFFLQPLQGCYWCRWPPQSSLGCFQRLSTLLEYDYVNWYLQITHEVINLHIVVVRYYNDLHHVLNSILVLLNFGCRWSKLACQQKCPVHWGCSFTIERSLVLL